MIRLFIIEDHPIVVSGLKRLFSSPARDGITVSGSSTTVEEVIEKVQADSFDIIILDLWLENKKPLLNYRMLKNQFPDKPVIILTSEESFKWQQRMYKEGAHAYIRKTADKDEVIIAIQEAMRNEKYFPSDLKQMNKHKNQFSNPDVRQIISPEVEELLLLLSQGYNHKTIATHLNVSESKIDKKLKELREKFNVHNSLELVLLFKKIHESD